MSSLRNSATAQKTLRAAVSAESPPPTRPGSLDGGGNESGTRLPPRKEPKDGTSLFLMPPWLQQVLPQRTHAQWAGEEAQCRLLQAARGGMLPGRRCGERPGWLDPDARTAVAQQFANAHKLERCRRGPSMSRSFCPLRICATTAVIAKHGSPVRSSQGTGSTKEPHNPLSRDGREWSNGCPNAVGRHPLRLSLKTLDWLETGRGGRGVSAGFRGVRAGVQKRA